MLFVNILLLLSKIDDEIGCIEDYFWKRDDEEVGDEDEEVEVDVDVDVEVEEVGEFNIS